jgi:peptidoglycan/xylan/chitin deacetylase (PgdA/CDA1 family)
MGKKITRRQFIQKLSVFGLSTIFTACQAQDIIPKEKIDSTIIASQPTQTPAPANPEPTIASTLKPPNISQADLIDFLVKHSIRQGDTSRPVVLMTYDDVGSPSMIESILSAYRTHGNSKATFFFVGDRLEICKKSVNKILSEGHEIGCHGWHHYPFDTLSDHDIHIQFEKFHQKILEIAPGYHVKYFRLPYGAGFGQERILHSAAEWDLQHVYWTMGSNGLLPTTDKIVISQAKNGSIVLSHMYRYFDYTQANIIVEGLISKGFSLESVATGLNPKDMRPT